MGRCRVLLISNLTPFNYLLCLILSFYFRVLYWKVTGVPGLLRTAFQRVDIGEYLDSDEWQLAAGEAARSFGSALKFWNRFDLLNIKVGNWEIDFLRQWVQWLSHRYEEYYRFLKFVNAYIATEEKVTVFFAQTFIYQNRNELSLQFPEVPAHSFSWFGCLDRMWLQFISWVALIRTVLKLAWKTKSVPQFDSYSKIRFVFAGISASEFAKGNGKLDFSFLVQNGHLRAEECLYVLPKIPPKDVIARLSKRQIQWTLEAECLSPFPLIIRLQALRDLLRGLIGGRIPNEFKIGSPILRWMAVKGVVWGRLKAITQLEVYASSQSASWPEEPAVSVMNSLGVRTASWFYSTNNYGILNRVDSNFNDKSLENGIWVSKEAWVWNESVKDWLVNRDPGFPKFSIEHVLAIGPIMCGDFCYAHQVSKSRKSSDITKDAQFNFISVFDVPALSRNARVELGLGPLMYTPKITNQFYQDLTELLAHFPKIGLILKPKRDLTDRFREYPTAFWNLAAPNSSYVQSGRVVILPCDIDPYLAISLSNNFIGLPFTSPVLFGLRANCHLLFHDPLKTFKSFMPKELDVLITRGKNELLNRVGEWESLDLEPNSRDLSRHMIDFSQNPAVHFVKLLKVESGSNRHRQVEQNSIFTIK